MTTPHPFATLDDLARHLREGLDKKYTLLFGFNGAGKTRLSMAFKDQGKQGGGQARDTLYYNAFTEDLFTWDNDLTHDATRVLRLNRDSRFFDGLQALEMENRIRPLLSRYADFDFLIDYSAWTVSFFRDQGDSDTPQPIKISRGEENIFIWCFFLAVAQLALDQDDGSPYAWVDYLYIDDPISSLDDNNAITVAHHLAQLLKNASSPIRTVISTHHHLFYNVLCNEFNKAARYILSKDAQQFFLTDTGDTPRFHHIAVLKQLHEVAESGKIFTFHFTILRGVLEKTAIFHGFQRFSDCIQQDSDDPDGILYARLINVLSHGNYSLFEPREMLPENKAYFRKILREFMSNYRFNPELFPP